jgi:flagellar M-ring protein FliF
MAADSATLPNASSNLAALPASLRPLLLLIGIAAAVAAGVWIVLWSRGPTYSLLYGNLSPQDEAQVAQALDAAQIPYRLEAGTNGIEVPAERLDEARLKLAGQGLTDNDSFAALEKSSGFGVSQFMEDVRYQHALEMELARTIASMQPIAGARVNLAEPRQSVFVSDNRTASASVFVQLKPGSSLDPEQVQAIINLVAASVPNLSPGEVTVVDQQGNLLSAPDGHDPYALDEREYDMVHRMETDYARRIEALLTPLVGPGLVHAQVVAELNMGTSEQAKELYTPDSQIVRSEHVSQQSAGGPAGGGVPGSLSNEPPAPGVAIPPAASPAKAGASGAAPTASAGQNGAQGGAAQSAAPAEASRQPATVPVGGAAGAPAGGNGISSDITRNYEIDRTLDYSKQPAGTIRRLTVAVLIGDRSVTGADGKVKRTPLSADELARITQLVKDAVGFDASRGDSVSVVNESLDSASAPAAADASLQAPPLWQSPFLWSLLRILAGLVIVLVLVLSVLRPLVRTLITPMRLTAGPAAGSHPLPAAAPGGPAGAAAALPSSQKDAIVTALTHEQQLAQARTLVNQDPKRVAQVVRGWVGNDE